MIKLLLRRLGAKYFTFLFRFYLYIKFRFTKFNRPPIIILTQGKVGSSSVYYSLKKNLPNCVYHIHRLSNTGIQKSIKSHKNSDRKSIPLHLFVAEILEKKLKNYNGKIYIITIVREPISRQISAFMQNIDQYKRSIEKKDLSLNIKKSEKILINKIRNISNNDLRNWIKLEINNYLNINIFEKPFNHYNQYNIYEHEKYSLLLMKMETMKNIFSKAVKELLKYDFDIQLEQNNVGENKYYASDYKKIKSKLIFDNKIIDEIYNSEFVKYFYTTKEIRFFKEKFLKN